MSDAPKCVKQALKVSKKGEKRAGKKRGKIGGSSDKKRNSSRKEAMAFTSTIFFDKSTQTLESQAKQFLS